MRSRLRAVRLPYAAVVACFGAWLVAGPAAAETTAAEPAEEMVAPESDAASVAARASYADAVHAYEERRYADAIGLFLMADRTAPNPAFDFNIGIAYEDMGDRARALSHYRSYLRRAPEAPDRADVVQRVERLEAELAKRGVQQVTVLSTPEGARFEIDGVPRGVTPWTGEIAPGFHELELDLRGHRVEERSFDLPPERAIDVPVTLTEEPPAPPVLRPERPRPPPKEPCSGACLGEIHAESWVIAGIGAASLLGALMFELDRRGLADAAEREQGQLEAARLYDDAQSSQKWATAFGVMGGAMLLSGAVLGYFDIREAKAPESDVALGCAPSLCGVSFRHGF